MSKTENPPSLPSDDEIFDAISLWHTLPDDGVELHDFLGWSLAEYVAYVSDDLPPERPLPESVRAMLSEREKSLSHSEGEEK